jgi:hypothetical protein
MAPFVNEAGLHSVGEDGGIIKTNENAFSIKAPSRHF